MRRLLHAAAASSLACALAVACDETIAVVPSTTDASTESDAGAAGDAVAPDVAETDAAPDAPPALLLSAQGLYQNIATKTVSPSAVEFSPAYALWSDGTVKSRWIVLPEGTTIDTSDMDHWQMPVGTKLFKEFALGGKRVETRLIERRAVTGQIGVDYFFGAFAWLPDESDAVYVPDGVPNALGTNHDVPSQAQCNGCHGGDPGFILGFSAIQLSKSGAPPTLKSLAQGGKLSMPPPGNVDYPVPGNATTAAALGALHANCGHCHQPAGFAFDETHMILRLSVGEQSPAQTQTVMTTVGVSLDRWQHPTLSKRVVPGEPSQSAVLYRMLQRGSAEAMPPLATKLVDDAGAGVVAAWIAALP